MKFLIDENLPYRFKLWNTINSVHVFDLDNISSDEEIWLFATQNNLTIISKDADFSDKIITKSPPPKVDRIESIE